MITLLVITASLFVMGSIWFIVLLLVSLLDDDKDGIHIGGIGVVMILSGWVFGILYNQNTLLNIVKENKTIIGIYNSKKEAVNYEIVDIPKIINKTKIKKDEKIYVIDSNAVECKCYECTKRRTDKKNR